MTALDTGRATPAPLLLLLRHRDRGRGAALRPVRRRRRGQPAFAVGMFAREQMNTLPGRVIHSAKSWLAHAGIDREARILPFATDESPAADRLSPVEASAAFLAYLKEAWDHDFDHDDPDAAFERQRVVVTVPASFDEGAQTLTRKAAELAGYPAVRLLEEPQAAFYAWLDGPGQPPGARSPGSAGPCAGADRAGVRHRRRHQRLQPVPHRAGAHRRKNCRGSSASPPATTCCWAATTSTSRSPTCWRTASNRWARIGFRAASGPIWCPRRGCSRSASCRAKASPARCSMFPCPVPGPASSRPP